MNEKALEDALVEIKKYYRTQGMAKELGFGQRPAVIVVDFQKGITDPQRPAGCNLDAEVENTALLLSKAREKEIPVFFFIIAYHESLVDGGLLVEKVPVLTNFIMGSDNVEIDSRLNLQPQEQVITKKHASSGYIFSCFKSRYCNNHRVHYQWLYQGNGQ